MPRELLRWQAGRSLSRVSGLHCSVKSDASVCARGKTEPRTHSEARLGQDQVGLVPAGTANSSSTSLAPWSVAWVDLSSRGPGSNALRSGGVRRRCWDGVVGHIRPSVLE